jgi:hypothetical protein
MTMLALRPPFQSSHHPATKVVAATIGSAIGSALSTVVIWEITEYCPTAAPPNVMDALTILFGIGLAPVFAFCFGYFKRASVPEADLADQKAGRVRTGGSGTNFGSDELAQPQPKQSGSRGVITYTNLTVSGAAPRRPVVPA